MSLAVLGVTGVYLCGVWWFGYLVVVCCVDLFGYDFGWLV